MDTLSPLSIGITLAIAAGLTVALVWRHRRVVRAANRPEVVAAASWWTRTIAGVAGSEGRVLPDSARRLFTSVLCKQLGRAFLQDGYYPTLSTQNGQVCAIIRKAVQRVNLPSAWIPADVAMFVYADCVSLKCGTEREDPLQFIWMPA